MLQRWDAIELATAATMPCRSRQDRISTYRAGSAGMAGSKDLAKAMDAGETPNARAPSPQLATFPAWLPVALVKAGPAWYWHGRLRG
jgi:hypothetical protein